MLRLSPQQAKVVGSIIEGKQLTSVDIVLTPSNPTHITLILWNGDDRMMVEVDQQGKSYVTLKHLWQNYKESFHG